MGNDTLRAALALACVGALSGFLLGGWMVAGIGAVAFPAAFLVFSGMDEARR